MKARANAKSTTQLKSSRSGRFAFTLIELLVVIAIIALLASLIIPSTTAIREYQYDAHCRSNLHQLLPALIVGLDQAGWKNSVANNELFDMLRCPKGGFDGAGNQALNVTGSIFDLGSPPPSVDYGARESNTVIYGFLEREGYVLPSAVEINVNQPGYCQTFNSSAGSIPAGTVVDCYYLFYDTVGLQVGASSGTISFSAPVIGLITEGNAMDNGDATLGYPNTAYPTGQVSRTFESLSQSAYWAEEIELSEDMLTLNLIRVNTGYGNAEHARVITESGGMGSGSYGVNGSITPSKTRPGQILMAEYGSSIIYPNSNLRHEDALDLLGDEDRLHFGRLNVGLVDGSIRGLDPIELESDSPRWYYQGP